MEVLATKVNVENLLGRNDTVWRCLRALPKPKRIAITLVCHSGLTHRELATVLSYPLGTTKRWLRRSLIQLKQCSKRVNE